MKRCSQCGREYSDEQDFCQYDGQRLHSSSEQTDPLIGDTLAGRYRIDSLLGTGNMGSVTRRPISLLDCLSPSRFSTKKLWPMAKLATRFEREKSIIARLRHPNILKLVDSFVDPQRGLVVVTELIEAVLFESTCPNIEHSPSAIPFSSFGKWPTPLPKPMRTGSSTGT